MSSQAAVPGTADQARSRARFVSVERGFNIRRLALAPRAFLDERDAAFDIATPSAHILLASSADLGTPHPATTPLLLACFLRIPSRRRIDNAPPRHGRDLCRTVRRRHHSQG